MIKYRSQFDKLFRTQFEGNGGLFVEDNLILSTEHGDYGGDGASSDYGCDEQCDCRLRFQLPRRYLVGCLPIQGSAPRGSIRQCY